MIVGGGIIESISTRKDRSLKIVIGTQEVGQETAGKLFGMQEKFIKYLFSENGIIPEAKELIVDVPLVAPTSEKKSHSKRLRDVLYVLWTQQPNGFEDAQKHYEAMMEKIISHYKERLE